MKDPLIVYPKAETSGLSNDGTDRNKLQALFQEELKKSSARREKEAIERANTKE